ncbi:hypothetical protein PLESTF_001044000 [Pleodorina starrii]|nr:hypothetical protein PLESTF_001044000 [Pleodorina starrii]
MILRGVCTMRQQEIDWMYGGGAGVLKPWAWQRFLDHLDLEERQAPLLSYYRRLLSPDASCRDAAARSWMEWEMSVGFDSRGQLLDWDGSQWSSLNFPATSPPRTPPRPSRSASSSAPATASAQRMASSREAKSGPDHDAPLLERVHALRHIPAIAVHGQMDLVCPPTTAFELHRAWPELQLRLVPGALHSMYDPAITHELVEATTLMYDVVKQA